jgi:50S ribosome-binding GTPase
MADLFARAFGLPASVGHAPSSARDGYAGPEHAPTRRIMSELKRTCAQLESTARTTLPHLVRAFGRLEARLARPLRVAIAGEFNSGKSSLANLLLGIESLPTAVVASTRIPTLLYHAAVPEIWAIRLGGQRERLRGCSDPSERSILRLEVGLPSPRLSKMHIVDLPGLADPRFDRGLGDPFLLNMDLLLWCTVATQAWKESERAAWEQLPARLRGRALLVVTHGDLLREAGDKEKLMLRLRQDAGEFHDIVVISTTEALALVREKRGRWIGSDRHASGTDTLETAFDQLLCKVRKQRTEAAFAVTGRMAQRALARLQ